MKFPKVLYVAIDGEKREEYFVANEDFHVHSVENDTRPVARYVLEEIGAVASRADYVSPKPNPLLASRRKK